MQKNIPLTTLGLNMTAGMILFSAIGYFIDQRTNNPHLFWTLIGMFAGLVYCGYEVWKILRNMNKLNQNTPKS